MPAFRLPERLSDALLRTPPLFVLDALLSQRAGVTALLWALHLPALLGGALEVSSRTVLRRFL